jgi:hypothetical protein
VASLHTPRSEGVAEAILFFVVDTSSIFTLQQSYAVSIVETVGALDCESSFL